MDDWFEKFNDDEEQLHFGADMRKYSIYAVIAYIAPIVFFVPFFMDKESSFCKFHSNQSFCWFIIMGIVEIISGILSAVSPITQLLGVMINIVVIAATIFLAVGAYKGYAIVIPILGEKIKLFK